MEKETLGNLFMKTHEDIQLWDKLWNHHGIEWDFDEFNPKPASFNYWKFLPFSQSYLEDHPNLVTAL
jgi:hypothetical protein